ncbi:hypothetical protein J1614_008087 [Plenodomus biglobosus]|nr:hypothetical protein J1614_008087 [Plenodomus biglobosus]
MDKAPRQAAIIITHAAWPNSSNVSLLAFNGTNGFNLSRWRSCSGHYNKTVHDAVVLLDSRALLSTDGCPWHQNELEASPRNFIVGVQASSTSSSSYNPQPPTYSITLHIN